MYSKFDKKSPDRATFESSVKTFASSVDPGEIYERQKQTLRKAIADNSYSKLLRLFNRKGLVNQICEYTGKTRKGFPKWVLREIDAGMKLENPSEIGIQLLEDLRKVFPVISNRSVKEIESAKVIAHG